MPFWNLPKSTTTTTTTLPKGAQIPRPERSNPICHTCGLRPYQGSIAVCPQHRCCLSCVHAKAAQVIREHEYTARFCCELQDFGFRQPEFRFLFGGRDLVREYFRRRRPLQQQACCGDMDDDDDVVLSASESASSSSSSSVQTVIRHKTGRPVWNVPQRPVLPARMTVTTETVRSVPKIKWELTDYIADDCEEDLAQALGRVMLTASYKQQLLRMRQPIQARPQATGYSKIRAWFRWKCFTRPLRDWFVGGKGEAGED